MLAFYAGNFHMMLMCQSHQQYFAAFWFFAMLNLHLLLSSIEIFLSCIRIEITVLYLKSARVNWEFDNHKYPFYCLHHISPSKTVFATIKSPMEADDSSNTILLFLNCTYKFLHANILFGTIFTNIYLITL